MKSQSKVATRTIGVIKSHEIPSGARNLSQLPDEARIDVKSVAVILGIATSTVWGWAARGLLPQPTRMGRTTRWRAGTIREIAAGGQ